MVALGPRLAEFTSIACKISATEGEACFQVSSDKMYSREIPVSKRYLPIPLSILLFPFEVIMNEIVGVDLHPIREDGM